MTGSINRQLVWAGVLLVVVVLCLAELTLARGPAAGLPVMPVLLLAALVILPPMVQRGLGPIAEADDALATLHASIRAGQARLLVLFGLAALATLAGIIALSGTLALPSATGAATTLDLSRPSHPVAGRVLVTSAQAAGTELRYQRDRFGLSPDTRFLPISDPAHRGAPWLVVQLPDDGLTFDPHTLPVAGYSGLLVADGLPPSVEASLRQNGALVPGHYWTLYTGYAELYRPYWLRAGARLLVALLLLAFAALEWRKLHALEAAEKKLRSRTGDFG